MSKRSWYPVLSLTQVAVIYSLKEQLEQEGAFKAVRFLGNWLTQRSEAVSV